jgi:hypothetical protein
MAPWTGDQPVARPLPTHRTTQIEETQTSMPRVGFEPTMAVFEKTKTLTEFPDTNKYIRRSFSTQEIPLRNLTKNTFWHSDRAWLGLCNFLLPCDPAARSEQMFSDLHSWVTSNACTHRISRELPTTQAPSGFVSGRQFHAARSGCECLYYVAYEGRRINE